MQMGFNNEFVYRDLRFHIQTEDRGLQAAKIESHIFHSGNILDTSVVSYEKLLAANLEDKERDQKIISMMKANHRLLYQRLTQGEYDNYVGLNPAEGQTKDKPVEPEDFAPTQDRVSEKVRLIEEGKLKPVDVAAETEGTEAVSLASLRDKLDHPEGSNKAPKSKKSTPPMIPSKALSHHETHPELIAFPDTEVKAFRGLVHQEPTLNVTELILKIM